MRRLTLASAIVTCAIAMAPSIVQAESCNAMLSPPNTFYTACYGSFVGNLNGSAAEITQLNTLFSSTFTYKGKTDDAAAGPFASNPGSVTSGVLTFDNTLYGSFVIGLKASNNYSFYQYNAGVTGLSSVIFNTAGTAVNGNNKLQDLSHAALYYSPNTSITVNSVVPEPSTYALMAAGLAGLGVVARRRRKV